MENTGHPYIEHQVAGLALDFKVAKAKKLGRREAIDTLNIGLNTITLSDPLSRRAASEADKKLLSSSFLVNGNISRRKSYEVLENEDIVKPGQ